MNSLKFDKISIFPSFTHNPEGNLDPDDVLHCVQADTALLSANVITPRDEPTVTLTLGHLGAGSASMLTMSASDAKLLAFGLLGAAIEATASWEAAMFSDPERLLRFAETLGKVAAGRD